MDNLVIQGKQDAVVVPGQEKLVHGPMECLGPHICQVILGAAMNNGGNHCCHCFPHSVILVCQYSVLESGMRQ
eukprot:14342887-Ditylum_brightwellii.AAC.1